MIDDAEMEACRNEAVNKLNSIALLATKDYICAIAESNIRQSEKDMKIIQMMEEAADAVKEAPFYVISDILKYYSEKLDE